MANPASRPRFGIGEFSRVTGLTVKTLRYYHEERLLVPAFVDPRTDYRYYDPNQVESARAIAFLRSLDVPVAEVRRVLDQTRQGEGMMDAVVRHRAELLS